VDRFFLDRLERKIDMLGKKGGGGRKRSPVRHHDFRYSPKPRDRVPQSKPDQVSRVEPWTEPDKYKPKSSTSMETDEERILRELQEWYHKQSKVDAEELIEKLKENPNETNLALALENMDKDFEELEREMLGDG